MGYNHSQYTMYTTAPWSPGVTARPSLWPLTLQFDRATQLFFFIWHATWSLLTCHRALEKKRDMRECYFLNSTCNIAFKFHMQHWHFLFFFLNHATWFCWFISPIALVNQKLDMIGQLVSPQVIWPKDTNTRPAHIWLLTPKSDTATGSFLKIDWRHRVYHVLVNGSFVTTGIKRRFIRMKSIHVHPPWCQFSGLFVWIPTFFMLNWSDRGVSTDFRAYTDSGTCRPPTV